jgi:uncharacterized membrane protein
MFSYKDLARIFRNTSPPLNIMETLYALTVVSDVVWEILREARGFFPSFSMAFSLVSTFRAVAFGFLDVLEAIQGQSTQRLDAYNKIRALISSL